MIQFQETPMKIVKYSMWHLILQLCKQLQNVELNISQKAVGTDHLWIFKFETLFNHLL